MFFRRHNVVWDGNVKVVMKLLFNMITIIWLYYTIKLILNLN